MKKHAEITDKIKVKLSVLKANNIATSCLPLEVIDGIVYAYITMQEFIIRMPKH